MFGSNVACSETTWLHMNSGNELMCTNLSQLITPPWPRSVGLTPMQLTPSHATFVVTNSVFSATSEGRHVVIVMKIPPTYIAPRSPSHSLFQLLETLNFQTGVRPVSTFLVNSNYCDEFRNFGLIWFHSTLSIKSCLCTAQGCFNAPQSAA